MIQFTNTSMLSNEHAPRPKQHKRFPSPSTLTARAEKLPERPPDLNDTITRLIAYQEAGADVLYAPGLKTKEDIAALVKAVERPVTW